MPPPPARTDMSSSTWPGTSTTRRSRACLVKLGWRSNAREYLLMPFATIVSRSLAARSIKDEVKVSFARICSRSLGSEGSKWIPLRSTITDRGGTRLVPKPTERTNPSSTRTSLTPRFLAFEIRSGEMREGQTASAPSSARAAESAREALLKMRSFAPGDHRKLLISRRFHQLIPQAATKRSPFAPRLWSITLLQSASRAIAASGDSQPSLKGSRIGFQSADKARLASCSKPSSGAPNPPGDSTCTGLPITVASATHSSSPCATSFPDPGRIDHGSTSPSSSCRTNTRLDFLE